MANDCCSLRIEGGEDITINQGEGINLAAGVYAYDSDGEPVPLYISPSEIDKCDVGEHVITYTASGKDNQMLPFLLCGENEVSVPEQCENLNTVTKKRIVTIKEADPPVIRWDNPTWIDPNEEFDPLEGVWARDDNGNRIEDINYYGKMDDMAEGDIASFETDLTDLLVSLKVHLEPIQDGYDSVDAFVNDEQIHTDFGRTIYGGEVDIVSGVLVSRYDSSLQPITPQAYQLTSHQIQTLVGQNNVWSEDGMASVIFTKSIPESGEFSYPLDGTYTIDYWVEDECGNETIAERQIYVGDYGEPE